ncbi:MAG: response regulator transcription factor [Chloroflexota bacterium]|nr:MAG: response regulator transcription factor [Chloroflexota bacterium]
MDDFQDRWIEDKGEGLTVCVVAPSPALLAGLHSLLSYIESIESIYELSSLDEIDPYIANTDILVLTPGFGSNIELREVLDNSPGMAVLIMIADDYDQNRIIAASSDHTWGVLPLEASGEQIEAAIQAIAAGLSVGMPSLLNLPLVDSGVGMDMQIVDPLTDREMEVLQLLAQGLANKQIAVKLSISEHTVKFHVSSIYTKLGVANRTEAVRMGVRKGLILL